MFYYKAYGLTIRSAFPLPEATVAEAAPDVAVRVGRVVRRPPVVAHEEWALWASPGEAHLYHEEVGAFQVRSGREIVVDAAPGADEQMFGPFVLGPVMALVLHHRNFLVLHASTVAVNGDAIAFLGKSGQGKSTLAAAFYELAHSIVADDLAAVHIGEDRIAVHPGFPRLKLSPETLETLGDDVESLPRLPALLDKHARPAPRGFPRRPLPLKRIYVLTDSPRLEIEPLRPQEAFMELVLNSYPAVANLLEASGSAAAHFRQCETLCRSVPILRLNSPRSLSAVPDVARLVEEDLALCPA